jgi:prolyl-tRNA synthetase
MKQSKIFSKTLKESPKDAIAISHKLLLKAGFIEQVAGGVYAFLPLGLKVLQNIERIIKEEMEKEPISGQQISMPCLTPKENWQTTGRWESFDTLLKIKSESGEYALGPTHEEIVVPLAKKIIFSYKDLPIAVYQVQTKFRNELRVKSGLLRTREFLMKDLYSFHASQEDLDDYYNKVSKAYFNIFERCGVKAYFTLASGGTFSKYSHEYQAITPAGEDDIFICPECGIAVNAEVKEDNNICPNCKKKVEFKKEKAVEVGNIFKLGTKYSEPFGLNFKDSDGKEKLVIMGCYGIGLGRLLGACAEMNNDEKGLIWPKEISPFKAHLLAIGENKDVFKEAEEIYKDLLSKGIDVLYDDRNGISAGEKFADSDLIGIPFRIVVSPKTIEKKCVEIKERSKKELNMVKLGSLEKFFEKTDSPAGGKEDEK